MKEKFKVESSKFKVWKARMQRIPRFFELRALNFELTSLPSLCVRRRRASGCASGGRHAGKFEV
jgi:hypothetical protein